MSGVKLRDSRPTIGMLSEIGISSYHNTLWAGFVDAAQELDVNLICYIGGNRNALIYEIDPQRKILYDLISDERVDGLIIANTSGNFVSSDQFRSFIDRYRPMPIVGIAPNPDVPCVVVDNESGMRETVNHFIEVHGYRRIAFICGPEFSREAALRYGAYVDALAAHDLPLNPDLVAPGNFIYEAGKDAIQLLLDKRQVEFDAVLAANDWMAFGALHALEERGIRVPDDVALGGFDDTREAAASHPSLTTVRQPIYKLGRASMEILLKLLAGEQVPDQTALPTKSVVRQSCGCPEPVIAHAAVGSLARKKRPLPEAVAEHRNVICSEMVSEAGEPMPVASDWAEQLLDAFLKDIIASNSVRTGGTPPQSLFLLTLDNILQQAMTIINQADNWQEVLSVMRRHLLPYITDVATLSRAEDLFNQGRVMVGKKAQSNRVRQELKELRRVEGLSRLSGELIAAVKTEQIVDVIGNNLPLLDFSTFYISFYDGQVRPMKWSKLMMACDQGEQIKVDAGGWRFPTRHLIPNELYPHEKRYTWVIVSLSFLEQQFGYIIFETSLHGGEIYGVLSRQISGVLQGSLLLQKHRETEKILARQAQELAHSNAELEQFAYIASHDLQEPLRMVKSYLQLIERRYKSQLDEDMDDFINFAIDGADRMRILISDLLRYSRVTTQNNPLEPIACSAILDQVLVNLKIAIEESGAVVTHDELPTVMVDEIQLILLLQNLISNAIKFRKNGTPPEIHMSAEHTNSEWIFSVRDNGIGIEPEYAERIFMIFKRLHGGEEYEGTGIGLAMCKKIVERYGGRIWVESELGEGSTFYFTLLDKASGESLNV